MTQQRDHGSAEHEGTRRQDHPPPEGSYQAEDLAGTLQAPAYSGGLLGDPRLSARRHAGVQIAVMRQAQQTYGNRAVQRYLQRQAAGAAPMAVQREGPAPATPAPAGGAAQAGGAASPAAPPAGLIVDDAVLDADMQPGQMRRRAFLAQTRTTVDRTVEQALPGPAQALVRPELEQQFATYSAQDSQTLERTIRSQVPGAGGAKAAADYIPLINEQVRQTVREQVPQDGGLLGTLAAGASAVQQGVGSAVSGIAAGVSSVASSIAGIFFKGREGSTRAPGGGLTVQPRLGSGQPLADNVRGGLETAFGRDFSGVRVHTDSRAAELTAGYDARAFTVGQNIAFGAGEYQPGTPVGDAIIAHEVAHVVQQGGAGAEAGVQAKSESSYGALEEDADTAATGAVVSMYGGPGGALGQLAQNALPRLRSGLRLQRCSASKAKDPAPSVAPQIAATDKDMGDHMVQGMDAANNGPHTADTGIHYAHNYKRMFPDKWKDDYWQGYADPSHFDRVGNMHWVLRAGTSASAGIKAWLKGLTIAECNSTIVALEIDSLRAAVGDKKFDAHFGSSDKDPIDGLMHIKAGYGGTPVAKFMKDTSSATGAGTIGHRPAIVGHRYYIYNHPKYLLKHPGGAWQGENSLYVGEQGGQQIWSGLGASNISEDEMLNTMVRKYNEERTDRDREVLKNKYGDKIPKIYDEKGGEFPASISKENILNDPEYTIGDTTRKGGFKADSEWALDPAKVQKLRDE